MPISRAGTPRRTRVSTVLALLQGAVTGRLSRYTVAEHSMRPTLEDGDWIVAVRGNARLRPGDVVVLAHPHRPDFDLVKRAHSIDGGVTVLGDDPGAGSVDSATFGPVDRSLVKGRVVLRYHPGRPRLIR